MVTERRQTDNESEAHRPDVHHGDNFIDSSNDENLFIKRMADKVMVKCVTCFYVSIQFQNGIVVVIDDDDSAAKKQGQLAPSSTTPPHILGWLLWTYHDWIN